MYDVPIPWLYIMIHMLGYFFNPKSARAICIFKMSKKLVSFMVYHNKNSYTRQQTLLIQIRRLIKQLFFVFGALRCYLHVLSSISVERLSL